MMNNSAFARAQSIYDNMLPPEYDPPEIPTWKIQEKLQEWVRDTPDWLLERLEEACIEDYFNSKSERGRYP